MARGLLSGVVMRQQHPVHLSLIFLLTCSLTAGCDLSTPDGVGSAAVVGGEPESGYPSAGYMAFRDADGNYYGPGCSLVLIAPDAALTAAHCVIHSLPADVQWVVGFGEVGSSPLVPVERAVPHPAYHNDLRSPTHDVAVLQLEYAVTGIEPAVVAAVAENHCQTRSVGYGRTTPGDQNAPGVSGERRSAAHCIDIWSDSMLLVSGVDGGACYGDSGGPLYLEETNIVVGVASQGAQPECAVGGSTYFTAPQGSQEFLDCALGASIAPGMPRDISCHYAESFIAKLVERGALRGYRDGSFRPNQLLTRAELAAMIAATLSVPAVRPALQFDDIDGHWAADAIQTVQRGGYMAGYSDGTFRPDAPVLRVEAIAALVSGLRVPPGPPSSLQIFDDAEEIPQWARGQVTAGLAADLIVNFPYRLRLRPQSPATRAEAAAMLYQALVYRNEAPPIATAFIPH